MILTKQKRSIAFILLFLIMASMMSVAIMPTANAASTTPLDSQGASDSLIGWYTISPKCAPNARLDVNGGKSSNGTNIQIYQNNNSAAQRFYLASVGHGYYVIVNTTGGVLDVNGGRFASGTNVQLWTYTYAKAQVWRIVNAGGGYFYLKPAGNENLALDVYKGAASNKTNVALYTWQKNNKAQMWKLNRTSPSGVEGCPAVSPVVKSYLSSESYCTQYTVKVKNSNAASRVTIFPAKNAATNQKYYTCQPDNEAAVDVRIVANNGRTLTYIAGLQCPKRYTLPAGIKEYTVYVVASDYSSESPARYHQLRIENGGIARVNHVQRNKNTV